MSGRFLIPVAMPKAFILPIVTSVLLVSPAVAQQGKTIQLNGQPWPGLWLVKDSKVYIQDHWLRDNLGVEFMDSDRPEVQKLRWFSNPLLLAVTYDQPVQNRFLAVNSLAQDWQTEVVGEILRIAVPPAMISNIRRSKSSGQDRLVIDLDRASPWQVKQQNNSIDLVIAAGLNPDLVKSLSNTPGNLIQSLAIETTAQQTILKITTTKPLTPNIQTLDSPARLVIDFQPTYTLPDLTIAWAKGLTQRQQTVTLVEGPKSLDFVVHSLIVNLQEPSISLKPIWTNPDTMTGTASLRAIANTWQAAGAINAGFFNRDRKMPVGAIRSGQRWLAGGVLTRGAVAWNESGQFFMDRLRFNEEIVTAQGNFSLTHLNSGFVQAGLARYTPNWGSTYTPLTNGETIILVNGDRITGQIKSTPDSKITIPENGYILVARKVPDIAARLTTGLQIRGITAVTPEAFNQFPNLIGAGPLLVKDGKKVLDAATERFLPPFDTRGAIRSAIATTNLPGQVILTTIHGTPTGTLPSLSQTAEILQKIGAINALNLDGGSSTTLYLGGKVLNRPTIAPVHNGIGIFINALTAK